MLVWPPYQAHTSKTCPLKLNGQVLFCGMIQRKSKSRLPQRLPLSSFLQTQNARRGLPFHIFKSRSYSACESSSRSACSRSSLRTCRRAAENTVRSDRSASADDSGRAPGRNPHRETRPGPQTYRPRTVFPERPHSSSAWSRKSLPVPCSLFSLTIANSGQSIPRFRCR